jgi:hypothetical protein
VATVTEIMKLARRLAQAEDRVDAMRSERDRLIVEAHARGESPKLLATAAGVSEQQVFKILRAAKKGT